MEWLWRNNHTAGTSSVWRVDVCWRGTAVISDVVTATPRRKRRKRKQHRPDARRSTAVSPLSRSRPAYRQRRSAGHRPGNRRCRGHRRYRRHLRRRGRPGETTLRVRARRPPLEDLAATAAGRGDLSRKSECLCLCGSAFRRPKQGGRGGVVVTCYVSGVAPARATGAPPAPRSLETPLRCPRR